MRSIHLTRWWLALAAGGSAVGAAPDALAGAAGPATTQVAAKAATDVSAGPRLRQLMQVGSGNCLTELATTQLNIAVTTERCATTGWWDADLLKRQQWYYGYETDKLDERIHTPYNQVCLGTRSGAVSQGTFVVTNSCGTAGTERWDAPFGRNTVGPVRHTIITPTLSWDVHLDTENGSILPGARAVIGRPVAGSTTQLWRWVEPQPPPAPRQLVQQGSGKCLTHLATTNLNIAVTIEPCAAEDGPLRSRQLWRYGGAEFDEIQNVWNNACLDLRNGSVTHGNFVVANACTGTSSQLWESDGVHLAPDDDGSKGVLYLDTEWGRTADGARAVVGRPVPGSLTQQWSWR